MKRKLVLITKQEFEIDIQNESEVNEEFIEELILGDEYDHETIVLDSILL